MKPIHYGTSLRAASTEQTLRQARKQAARFGITRVTDVTRLDRIGIPVCISIRPGASVGSACVTAGKGSTPEEARAGAWMEAIEHAIAEPGGSALSVVPVPARDVLDGRSDPPAILDLCPLLGAPIRLSEAIPCVQAEEILSGTSCYLPAELVFLPAPPACSSLYFGASTNGLASGNTLLEATVHGLAEVIEHDIRAFYFIRDNTALVPIETFPPQAAEFAGAIRAAGLQLFVRYQPNAFGLPFFRAVIADPDNPSPLFLHGGYGCHPHRTIALLRAIVEAAQSRLTFLQGGRDDLTDWFQRIQHLDDARKRAQRDELYARASRASDVIDFARIPDYAAQADTLESCFDLLAATLARAGIHRICRVTFTTPDEAFQVVRIIVPLLEAFDVFSVRVGQRLRDYAEA